MVKEISVTSVYDEGSVANEGDRSSANATTPTSAEANVAVNAAVNEAPSPAVTPTSTEANTAVSVVVNTASSAVAHTTRRSNVWYHFTEVLDDSNFTHEHARFPASHNKTILPQHKSTRKLLKY